MIEVIKPGAQTSIQDAGRLGYLPTGLSPAGAMDNTSIRIGNFILDNEVPSPLFVSGPRGDACIECTFHGPTLRFENETVIALTGGMMPAKLNGEEVDYNKTVRVPENSILQLGIAKSGARTYICVAGGLQVEEVLGSRSQNLFASRGPMDGKILKTGNRIPYKDISSLGRKIEARSFDVTILDNLQSTEEIRVVPGPQDFMFQEDSYKKFFSEKWTLSPSANRMGMRFNGPQLKFNERPSYLARDAGADPSNIVDDVIPVGGIQCPSGMEAIVMGVENPTVGGFAKIATVISSDLSVVAQMRPGQKTCFRAVSVEEASEIAEAVREIIDTNNLIDA